MFRVRVVTIVALFVAVMASTPWPVAAQDAEPVQYPEYRAAIAAFTDAEAALSDSAGTVSTVDESIARFEETVQRYDAEVARLAAVTPEPCYADAHEEYMAYWRYRIATFRDTIPLMADAESVMGMGMLPMILIADATIRKAHPLAYVEDQNALGGFQSEPMNIFDSLATCEPLPTASPTASDSPVVAVPTGSPKPPATIFADSGQGTKRTAPFELEPGDHRLSYEAHANGSMACGLAFALVATDDSYRADVGYNGAWVYEGKPYRNSTWFYVSAAGRYYLDVGGDCVWDATLESAPSPFGVPPITVTGSGLGTSPSFGLEGGDYVVRYVLTSPRSDEDCTFSAEGIVDPASPYQDLGGEIRTTIDSGSETEGETYVYGLDGGRYVYEVGQAWCQFGLSEPVEWEITIEGQ